MDKSPSGVLIVFASKYGQTEKIAARLGELITETEPVELWRAGEGQPSRPLDSYRGIVVGSAVFAGRHMNAIEEFIVRNRTLLHRLPSAFFSVSGSAGGTTDQDRLQAREQMETLLTGTLWSPLLRTTFGGAMSFSKYNWLMRWFVRLLMKSKGEVVDGRSDVVYTNWDAVAEFGREYVRLLNTHVPAAA